MRSAVGSEVGRSEPVAVTQAKIDAFAAVTGDAQWIHVEPARAARESPFGTTIAHGFLTLSLLPALMRRTIEMFPARLSVNYGLDRVRFIEPVVAGANVSARFVLAELDECEGYVGITWDVEVWSDAAERPVLVARWLGRLYV